MIIPVSFQAAHRLLAEQKEILLLDVREEEEYITGHAIDAVLFTLADINAESAAEVMKAVCAAAEQEMDSLAANTHGEHWKDYLLNRKSKKLAEMQARAVQTSVDKDMNVHYRYVVDRAIPAEKKDRPKRALIVLGCSLGAVVVCIFGLLIFAPRKEEDEQ